MYNQLLELVFQGFGAVEDHRKGGTKYSLQDCLMSAFAMFSLKDPSLLSFVSNYAARKENLEQVFKLQQIPSENGLRKILDSVAPDKIRPTFKQLFSYLSENGLLENRRFLGNKLLVSVDGTGTYASNTIGCSHCLTKKRKNGEIEYHHQLLAASVVTPELSTVFPVFGEAITRQDGATKNDCERNACKRLLPEIRAVLPDEKIVVLLDGLYADGRTIRALQKEGNDMDFIIVIKEGYVLEQVAQQAKEASLNRLEFKKDFNRDKPKLCRLEWSSNLILNGANQEIRVNYLAYKEIDLQTGTVSYSNKWITNLALDSSTVEQVAQAGRTRWKIENKTFNTLKNQGYNLEHNYGHGQWFLATIFALVMLLAFFVDQLTRALDEDFKEALIEAKTLRDCRQKVRVLFDFIPAASMNLIYQIIARKILIAPKLE